MEQGEGSEEQCKDCLGHVEGFRLSVDLSRVHGVPAQCFFWIGASAQCEKVPEPGARCGTVRSLGARVRAATELRVPFCLRAAEHMLPPDEPLHLLKPSDTITVEPIEHAWQVPFSCATVTVTPPSSVDQPPVEDVKSVELLLKPGSPPPVDLTTDPGSPCANADNALQHGKRQALAMLQELEFGAEAGPGKKRRRRVRRRRTPRSLSPDALAELSKSSMCQSVSSCVDDHRDVKPVAPTMLRRSPAPVPLLPPTPFDKPAATSLVLRNFSPRCTPRLVPPLPSVTQPLATQEQAAPTLILT